MRGSCAGEGRSIDTAEVMLGQLYSWSFLRALSVWTTCITKTPSLALLAYPLAMVAYGAVNQVPFSIYPELPQAKFGEAQSDVKKR